MNYKTVFENVLSYMSQDLPTYCKSFMPKLLSELQNSEFVHNPILNQ